MACGLGYFCDGLYAGGTSADHRDALASELHRFFRPIMRMAGLALERLDAGDGRHCRRRQHTDSGNQETRIVVPAVFQNHIPTARVLLVAGGADATPELDVAAQIELVSNVVQIALRLGLPGEVLLPVPFVK